MAVLLEVDNLHTHFKTSDGHGVSGLARAVDGVSFSLEEGQCLALVGESGSGKSVSALSLMGLVRAPGFHPAGRVVFEGQDVLTLPESAAQHLRGNRMSMIFQEPMTALNPVFTVGTQVMEPLMQHQGLARPQARQRAAELLERLGLSEPEALLGRYPHQLSGGMRQRVMIAMAMACRPRLMIADEPTTALDVTVQAQILYLLDELRRETGMALLLITHDMGVVRQMADRVAVMYAGKVAETARVEDLFAQPAHPYTQGLLKAMPRGIKRGETLAVIPGMVAPATAFPDYCRFEPRCGQAQPPCRAQMPALYPVGESVPGAGHLAACLLVHPTHPLSRLVPSQASPSPAQGPLAQSPDPTGGSNHLASTEPLLRVEGLTTHFPIKSGFWGRVSGHVRAVDGVSLDICPGETLGLVGESGSGKSTLGVSLLRLEPAARGRVVFLGQSLEGMNPKDLRALRRQMQVIFQDPFSALNPRMKVGELVSEGLRVHEPAITEAERQARTAEALEEVGLGADAMERYPHAFSGGQRQRVALARALVLRPRFLVLDEPTSALDVSVQAQILNLLADLRVRHGLTFLFITHDLGVVEYLAHRVAVMYLGRVVEQGPTQAVFAHPAHPYTQSLLAAQPGAHRRGGPPPVWGEVPSPVSPPAGCHFHPRCPLFKAQATASSPDARLDRCPLDYPAPRGVPVNPQGAQTPGGAQTIHDTSAIQDLGAPGVHWATCHGV